MSLTIADDLFSKIRELRHGKLKPLGRVFYFFGQCYRKGIKLLGVDASVSHFIGPYGPFKLNAEFAFSNFKAWGKGHNNGFVSLVEASSGKNCIFDVGAHIGLVSLPMSRKINANGKIYAFEPAVANRRHLLAHLRKNRADNVEVIEDLVGEEALKGAEFFESASATGQNSIIVKKDFAKYSATKKNQTTLDLFCEAIGRGPEIIKIDVEGAEIGVLRGAKQTIEKFLPVIYLSVHPLELKLLGRSTEELEALVNELGYDSFEINGAPVKNLRFEEYILLPKKK